MEEKNDRKKKKKIPALSGCQAWSVSHTPNPGWPFHSSPPPAPHPPPPLPRCVAMVTDTESHTNLRFLGAAVNAVAISYDSFCYESAANCLNNVFISPASQHGRGRRGGGSNVGGAGVSQLCVHVRACMCARAVNTGIVSEFLTDSGSHTFFFSFFPPFLREKSQNK